MFEIFSLVYSMQKISHVAATLYQLITPHMTAAPLKPGIIERNTGPRL